MVAELFFEGGVTIRSGNEQSEKALNRKMRALASKNRLAFSGRHIVIDTRRAQRRAIGAGIEEGQSVSKAFQKSLVASGMSRDEAADVKWESMW